MYKHLWKPLGMQNFKKEPKQLMRENVGWEKEIGVPSWTKILKIVGEYGSACSVGALILTWPSVTDTVVCCWDSLLQDNLPADKLTAQDSELSLLPRTTLGITSWVKSLYGNCPQQRGATLVKVILWFQWDWLILLLYILVCFLSLCNPYPWWGIRSQSLQTFCTKSLDLK